MRLPGAFDPRELGSLLPRALRLVSGAEQVLLDVQELIGRIEAARESAEGLVSRIDATTDRADVLMVAIERPVFRLLPVVERLADATSPEQVDGLVALLDTLPELATKMQTDVLPVLDSLTSVAPDMHELLSASRELNEMLGQLPGMGRVKKRVEAAQEEAQEEAHEEEH